MAGEREMHADRTAVAHLATALFEAYGAPHAPAVLVTEHLIEADEMGVPSHGVIRVPQYLAEIESGELEPGIAPVMKQTGPGRVDADGGRGFGQVVGMAMVEAVGSLARRQGVAVATGRRMGHTGRIGAYAEALARRGFLGIVVCSGPRSGHWVAPFGGRDGRLSTNPMAFSCPVAGSEGISADFSTAATAEGVVRSLRNRGLRVPEGVLRDSVGNPTTDPNVLHTSPRGAIQPLGGALGYRGTALALMVELLASTLAGDDTEDESRVGSNLTMVAILVQPAFADRAARLARHVRSSRPIDPDRPVLLPGDRERTARSLARGVSIDGPTWTALERVAGRAGLSMPAPAEG